MTNHPGRGYVRLHPNYGESCVLVGAQPYYWDGSLDAYRRGYGPYATAAKIGDWKTPTPEQARRIRREVRAA